MLLRRYFFSNRFIPCTDEFPIKFPQNDEKNMNFQFNLIKI